MLRSYLHNGSPAEENPIFDAWNLGIALHEEFPASVCGLFTTAVAQAELFP